jgi:hypothetical protein
MMLRRIKMHICENRLGKNLNDIERVHIAQCQECAYQHQLMTDLNNNVNTMELIEPPVAVWEKLARSSVVKRKKRVRKWVFFAAVAASTSFISFTWLMFNNYQLQNQLELVLQVNQSLELQLTLNKMPTFKQAQLITLVREIEYRLHGATTVEKLALLKERQQLVSKIVNLQKGNSNEYSI